MCTLIAVDFDTQVPNGKGGTIWDSRLFRTDQEHDARAFLAEKQRTCIAAISKRMARVEGDWFRVEWVADGGRIVCESEGRAVSREP
jgi:hypothetical protein